MAIDWSSLFDNFGVKLVSPNDRAKNAYFPNREQRAAIAAAGIIPTESTPTKEFTVEVLFDDDTASVAATYYRSLRDPGKRRPEPRMGREIISSWMKPGDRVVIGNIGNRLYIAKEGNQEPAVSDAGLSIAKGIDKSRVLANAKKASGKPPRKDRKITDFVRNLWVVAGAIQRADGKCEMPKCAHVLFTRQDGTPFLEVHHVFPLGEGGEDSLENAAALCPMCHRELHFGSQKQQKRATLAAEIAAKIV